MTALKALRHAKPSLALDLRFVNSAGLRPGETAEGGCLHMVLASGDIATWDIPDSLR